MTFKKLQANNNFSNPSPNGKFLPTAGRTRIRPSFSSLSAYSTRRSVISWILLTIKFFLKVAGEMRIVPRWVMVQEVEDDPKRGREEEKRDIPSAGNFIGFFLSSSLTSTSFLTFFLPTTSTSSSTNPNRSSRSLFRLSICLSLKLSISSRISSDMVVGIPYRAASWGFTIQGE
jgi:hypothetical protein